MARITEQKIRSIIREVLQEDAPASFDVEDLDSSLSWITDPIDKYKGRADVADEYFKIAPETTDIDLARSSQNVRRFASASGIIARRLGLSPPVITSGKRSAQQQAVAMQLKFNSGEDLYDLYINQCRECTQIAGGESNARDLIDRLIQIFSEKRDENISQQDAMRQAIGALRETPISAHQAGMSIDFRIAEGMERIFRELRPYSTFSVIDETSTSAPHWHVFVRSFSRSSYERLADGAEPEASREQEGVDPDIDAD